MARCLIVDDDEDIRDSISAILQLKLPDLELVLAESGPRAIELLETEKIDVIVTDYKMPQMTGLEMLEELEKKGHKIPALLLTAFDERQRAVEAARSGRIRRFHRKPPNLDSLLDSIRELLPGWTPDTE